MTVSEVVFDIGGVLVEWDPAFAFSDALGGYAAAQAFIARTGFHEKNIRADSGASFAGLAQEIENPDDRALFARYVANYGRTIQTRIEGTWALLDRLRARGVPTHAITNWGRETWESGLKTQPRLGEVFDTLVVSAREGVAKPDHAIFALFCERAGRAPGACLFIDDKAENADAARAFGMDAVVFTDPVQLARDLTDRGML